MLTLLVSCGLSLLGQLLHSQRAPLRPKPPSRAEDRHQQVQDRGQRGREAGEEVPDLQGSSEEVQAPRGLLHSPVRRLVAPSDTTMPCSAKSLTRNF